MSSRKRITVITSHRDLFWPVAEELRPEFEENTKAWIHVHDQTTENNVFVKMTVSGDGVNGLAKKFYISLKDKEKVVAELCHLTDNLPTPITMDWLKQQGFTWD